MKRTLVVLITIFALLSSLAAADSFGTFDIDFVTISGSTNPTSGIPAGNGFTFTGVNNDYRISTYEITNAQFAKSADNSNVHWTGADVPSNRVSWFEAAQFVNYLNTSTGNTAAYKFSGSTFTVWDVTDTGYDASNPFRNSNAKYFMPTENEWVKAAYWNGSALQTYSNVSAGDLISGSPDPTKWNYDPSVGNEPWNATSGVKELNNTYNMMGNVWEWMESPYTPGDYKSGSDRGLRGGSYASYYDYVLASSLRNFNNNPYYEGVNVGFRVASIVPEPCTLLLLALGGLLIRRK